MASPAATMPLPTRAPALPVVVLEAVCNAPWKMELKRPAADPSAEATEVVRVAYP